MQTALFSALVLSSSKRTSALSLLRAINVILAPIEDNETAVYLPMPDVAPVIKIFLSLTLNIIILSFYLDSNFTIHSFSILHFNF